MPPVTSPTRRVLGEKDANASLNTLSPRKNVKAGIESRNVAAIQASNDALSGAINALKSSPRTGQKRRIAEVDGVEAHDWDERVKASQATEVVSDSASETDQLETSMLSTRSMADTTMTSFGIGASQEVAVDQQFELLEPDMSQRTLDKIHAVPLPQNMSQPSQLQTRPELVQNNSLDSVAMSNFFNLHSDPSSQGSERLQMIGTSALQDRDQEEVEAIDGQAKGMSEEDERKVMMDEKAAQLRTRLQLAFFKVETRQTNTPFSRLKVPESHRRKSLSPPSLLPPQPHAHNKQSQSISVPYERTGFSPEARIAALRAQATMQHKPSVRALNSLAVPELKPTAYSARWAEELSSSAHGSVALQLSRPQIDEQDDQPTNIPSSPPISSHSVNVHEDETASRSKLNSPIGVDDLPDLPIPKTPAVKEHTNDQLSSPPLSDGADNLSDSGTQPRPGSQSKGDIKTRERRLTSSAVKGEAASGLLQLMRSGLVNAENVRGPMCGL